MIKIVCINLEKSIDRRKFMTRQFEKLGIPFEFFDAIDATELELRHEVDSIYKIYYKGIDKGLFHDKKVYVQETATGYGKRHYRNFGGIPYADVQATVVDNTVTITFEGKSFYTDISSYKKELSMAELGCALSHYYVTLKCCGDGDTCIIFEDDTVLDDGKLDLVLKHLAEYDLFWDMAFLNIPQHVLPDSLIHYSDLFNLGVFSGYSGTYSYVLNKKGAQRLFQNYNGFVNMASDDFLAHQVHLRQLRIKESICWPNDEFDSTIKTNLYI